MTNYAIQQDGFKFQELDLDINDLIESFPETYDYGQVHDFSQENIAMKDFWPNFQTGWREIEGEENLIPDITPWINATLVLSSKAHRFLADTLSQFGELLPFTIDGDTFYIFNCLNLDESGLVFKSKEHHCFDVLCNEVFKTSVENFGLTGIVFQTDY